MGSRTTWSSGGLMGSSFTALSCFLGFQFMVSLLLSGLQLQVVEAQGTWEVIVNNAGIASMHTAVTRFNTAVLLDRTDIGPSQLPLPDGICRTDPNDEASVTSVEF